jgi:hypothetical protein
MGHPLPTHFGQSAQQAHDPLYIEAKAQAHQTAQEATGTQHTGPTIIINMGPPMGDAFEKGHVSPTPTLTPTPALSSRPMAPLQAPNSSLAMDKQEPVKPAPQSPIPYDEQPSTQALAPSFASSTSSSSAMAGADNVPTPLTQWINQGIDTHSPEFLKLLLQELQLPRATLPVAPDVLLATPNKGNVWEGLTQGLPSETALKPSNALSDGLLDQPPTQVASQSNNSPIPSAQASQNPSQSNGVTPAQVANATPVPPSPSGNVAQQSTNPQVNPQANPLPANPLPAQSNPAGQPPNPANPVNTPNPAGGDETYKFAHAFNDPVIQSLNRRFNDPDPNIRSDAATEFYQIISSNPGIVTDHRAKPYIEAFAKKIARDSSSNVHVPLLLALESGLLKDVSPSVIEDVRKIKDNNGMLGMEPAMVNDALRAYEFQTGGKSPTPQASTVNTSPHNTTGTPPSTTDSQEGAKAESSQTPKNSVPTSTPHKPTSNKPKQGFWQRLWPWGKKHASDPTPSQQQGVSEKKLPAPQNVPLTKALHDLPISQLKEEQNPSPLPPAYPRAYSEEAPPPNVQPPQSAAMQPPLTAGTPMAPSNLPAQPMGMPPSGTEGSITPTSPLTGQDALNDRALQEAMAAIQAQQTQTPQAPKQASNAQGQPQAQDMPPLTPEMMQALMAMSQAPAQPTPQVPSPKA